MAKYAYFKEPFLTHLIWLKRVQGTRLIPPNFQCPNAWSLLGLFGVIVQQSTSRSWHRCQLVDNTIFCNDEVGWRRKFHQLSRWYAVVGGHSWMSCTSGVWHYRLWGSHQSKVHYWTRRHSCEVNYCCIIVVLMEKKMGRRAGCA